MENKIHDVVIIGSGPAGLTAAIYVARAELNPVVIMGDQPGGQLMWTSEVENFPGFPEGINGPQLMQNMIKQAQRFKADLKYEKVEKVEFNSRPFSITTNSNTYQSKTVIIATGASARWLGLESEEKFKGKGVSACATCDGAFFKEKKVFVVGGGDSAMEEATFLTKFASSVTILVRGDKLSASKIMQERAESNEKITFMYDTEVQEVLGDTVMSGLKVLNNKTKETKDLEGQGLFVVIGHTPNTAIFKNSIDIGKGEYLVKPNPENYETNVKGVFVAGDVFDWKYRQAITAAGYGCMAAIETERYLAKMDNKELVTGY